MTNRHDEDSSDYELEPTVPSAWEAWAALAGAVIMLLVALWILIGETGDWAREVVSASMAFWFTISLASRAARIAIQRANAQLESALDDDDYLRRRMHKPGPY
jgi:hypothetical protein